MSVNFPSFEQTEEWTRIKNHVQELLTNSVDDLITAAEQGNVAKASFIAGRMAMMKEVLTLPEWLYSIDRSFKKGEKDAAD